MNKRNLLFFVGGLAFSLSAVAAVTHFTKDETPLTSVTASSTDAPSGFFGKEEPVAMVDVISVTSPFENWYTKQQTKPITFQAPSDDSFSKLDTVTPLAFADNQLTLPSSFVDHGPDETNLSSNQPTTITEMVTFQNDASIVWEAPGEYDSPNYSWADHPDHLIVAAGQTALISYTTSGKDSKWVGSVTIQ